VIDLRNVRANDVAVARQMATDPARRSTQSNGLMVGDLRRSEKRLSEALVSIATALERAGDRITKARLALAGVAHGAWLDTAIEIDLVRQSRRSGLVCVRNEGALRDAKACQHQSIKRTGHR
jgi:CO/xanthine dehydrogenase FAD-binding subunit